MSPGTSNSIAGPGPDADLARLAARAFDALPGEVAIVDRGGMIALTNRAWRLFGSLNGFAPSQEPEDYLATCDRAADAGDASAAEVARGLRRVLGGEVGHFEMEYPCDSPTEERWFLLQTTPLADGSAIVVTHTNITQRKLLEEHHAFLAHHDQLTGLLNRAGLAPALDEMCESASTQVLVCDLDGFKAVNDTYGHAVGDEVLVQVAARLRKVLGPADRAFRIGGDEFVVLTSERRDVDVLCRSLEHALDQPYLVGGQVVACGASVGRARADEAGSLAPVLQQADHAMYRRKRERTGDRRAPAPAEHS